MFDEPEEVAVKPKKVASIFDDDEDEDEAPPAKSCLSSAICLLLVTLVKLQSQLPHRRARFEYDVLIAG